LLGKLIDMVVARGRVIDSKVVDEREGERKLAGMLRLFERAERKAALDLLREDNEVLAKQIEDMLYSFEDLLRIEDRSLQQVLSEVDSNTLALSLKGGDLELAEKVKKNLSKRARETLTEEMEFMTSVTKGQIEEAQKRITEIIARKDLAGELTMME
jgi:flagellar motor switch protein FliG